jgi:anti-sigma B factor antagonist
MNLRLRTYQLDDVSVVEVAGEIELNNAARLRTELRNVCETAACRVVVDMSRVTFIDSTGIGVLVGALKRTREHDGSFALVCPQPRVRRVFEITGLLQALPLSATIDEALGRSTPESGIKEPDHA